MNRIFVKEQSVYSTYLKSKETSQSL